MYISFIRNACLFVGFFPLINFESLESSLRNSLGFFGNSVNNCSGNIPLITQYVNLFEIGFWGLKSVSRLTIIHSSSMLPVVRK